MAEAQHVRAVDLLAEGAVQRVVPEYEADTVRDVAVAVAAECAAVLGDLATAGRAADVPFEA
jgi:acetyl-CoA carboxylase carboxyl transferase subunit beta